MTVLNHRITITGLTQEEVDLIKDAARLARKTVKGWAVDHAREDIRTNRATEAQLEELARRGLLEVNGMDDVGGLTFTMTDAGREYVENMGVTNREARDARRPRAAALRAEADRLRAAADALLASTED